MPWTSRVPAAYREPIVEANTQRLYCRLLGYAGDPKSAEGQRTLWQFAEDVLPAVRG